MTDIALFLSSLAFIFLAALPGRTTFILLMLAAQRRPIAIFVGAGAAFFLQSVISVLLGGVLAHLPSAFVHIGASALFIFFAYKFWIEIQQSPERTIRPPQSIKSIFFLIFVAECGDVSQLAIATVSASSSSRLIVLIASICALWIITGVAVLAGRKLTRIINPNLLQKFASFAFLIIGLWLAFKGLRELT